MKKGMKEIFLSALKIFLISLLSIILIFNIYIMIQAKSSPNKVPSIFGYKPFVVMSGSMEPKINKGDLIFVKKVDTNTLNVGDVIAFRNSDNTVTTHRIKNIMESKNRVCYETKGDNNNTSDEDITCDNLVEGKYVSKIAKIGNFIIFVQEPMGFTILMLTILIICIFIYFMSSGEISEDMIIKDEEELKAFNEFKKAREKAIEQPEMKEKVDEVVETVEEKTQVDQVEEKTDVKKETKAAKTKSTVKKSTATNPKQSTSTKSKSSTSTKAKQGTSTKSKTSASTKPKSSATAKSKTKTRIKKGDN